MRTLGVVHLVWAPLAVEPFRRFIRSYRQHAAGLPHRLLIVFNGFASPADLAGYEPVLEGVGHHRLVLPKPVQDIAAYFAAARDSAEDDLCFLNSYSVILAGEWLAKLHAALGAPDVGLVGATGSHESLLANLRQQGRPIAAGGLLRRLVRHLRTRRMLRRTARDFAGFPNPHLRTNAFMLARQRLLALEGRPIRSKEDAYRFENGRNSLTARLLRAGWQSRVVDRHGHAWAPADWRASHTFRAGEQENLLISDNRTRDYQEADPATRRLLARFAWGIEEPA